MNTLIIIVAFMICIL